MDAMRLTTARMRRAKKLTAALGDEQVQNVIQSRKSFSFKKALLSQPGMFVSPRTLCSNFCSICLLLFLRFADKVFELFAFVS